MKNLILNPPALGFVVGTRAALAFGVGLLLANRFSDERRRKVARSLITLGAVSTLPAARMVLGRRTPPSRLERAKTWARGMMGRSR